MKQINDNEKFLNRSEDFIIVGETDKGHQEQNMDLISYAVHPKFPNVKLLILADGDSKAKDGAAGAQFFCDKIEKQFINLKEEHFNDVEQTLLCMVVQADKFISKFNKVFDSECIAVGAAVIIVDDTFYCLTIGDVRVYYSSNGEIKKINNIGTDYDALKKYHDELKSLDLSEKGLSKILNSINPNDKQTPFKQIGCFNSTTDDDVYSVSGFDSIFIMSDGVSNHISDENKAKVIKNIDPEFVPQSLIEVAEFGYTVVNDCIMPEENLEFIPSRDNLSVIGYVKSKAKVLTK